MKIRYEIGDATRPNVPSPYWILQGNNNIGAWGAGFVLAINNTFGVEEGSPFKEYLRWFDDSIQEYNITPQLGDIQFVSVGNGNKVINMITQKGCGPVFCRKTEIGIPFRYEAFEECLLRVSVFAREFEQRHGKFPTLISPRIGCGLAMASWTKVEHIIEDVFLHMDIEYVVYDLPQQRKVA
jgi:hypothetical protein